VRAVPSATDKARAIFTWFHHNMDYDVASFVNHLGGVAIAPSTPAESILSGVGVCAGYAGSYAAIATAAGLECTVVNGHGKGVGYRDWQAGEPVPAYDMNHAWNAVRIDGGSGSSSTRAGAQVTSTWRRRLPPQVQA
jgi:transglutaminase/protease-like cytokinesis protein 3